MPKNDLVAHEAMGLPADWLNAWLAAIGVTVLLPEVKLSWTDEVVPHAVFWTPPGMDVPSAVFDAMPTVEDLADSPISPSCSESEEVFPRTVKPSAYQSRAQVERQRGTLILAASVTDLTTDDPEDGLPHSPFDPPAPRGETLGSRVIATRRLVADADEVQRALAGTARRSAGIGLGFDCRRGISAVHAGRPQVDATIELLAYAGLDLFPFRGDGQRQLQRLWTGRPTRRGSLSWAVWGEPLDRWAIDAFLDAPRCLPGACWSLVPFRPSDPKNVNRYYYGEPSR